MAKLFKRRNSDKWQAECYWYDASADVRRRHAESTGITDDGTEAAKLTAQINADKIERGLAARGPAKKSKTLKAAIAAVVEEKELAERAAGTVEATLDRAVHLLTHFGESAHVADIDADAVRKYAVAAKRSRGVLTVHGELVLLGSAFRVAGLEHPPWPHIGERVAKPQRPLEVDEQQALLRYAPERRRLSLRAYLQLGLRFSELWKLGDLDFATRYVHVHGTKTKRSQRDVPVPADLLARLQPFGADWQQAFPPWAKSACCELLTRAGREIGFLASDARLSPNDLRGTYATHMARAGVQPQLLATFMGSSVKQLEQVYAQLQIRAGHHHEAVRVGVPLLVDCDDSASNTASNARTATADL